jgi:SAM-dependent methyltransferase
MRYNRLRRADFRIENRGPTVFLLSSLAHYGVRALVPRGITRDANHVLTEYNHGRQELWKTDLSLAEYVFGDNRTRQWILKDDRVQQGTERDVREPLLSRLVDHVRRNSDVGDTIIEFGAGTARNLAHLARTLPDRKYLGVELTPNTVDEARSLLARFGLPVELMVGDITSVTLDCTAAVSYSFHALEQLPGARSRDALARMAAVTTRSILCLEPIRELYEMSLRGIASRLRQARADYLQNLRDHAIELGLDVASARRLGMGRNPLNETCELTIRMTSQTRTAS